MKKKNMLKIALMGIAIGSSMGGCQTPKAGDAENTDHSSCSGKSSCKGKSGCGTEKSNCSGKSSCSGGNNMQGNQSSNSSSELQQKRDVAAKEMKGQ